MPPQASKVLFITGASRGIGKAIALRAAKEGARVAVIAKTSKPHAHLPGTIRETAEEIEQAGGEALPLVCDVRFSDQIDHAVAACAKRFGGIDALINNASAISLTDCENTPLKRFDLMMNVNTRATFACTQACLPHLRQSTNPHVLVMSPPINLAPHWFGKHVAYTISKYGMSMCVLGLAEEFREYGIAVNALWPKTAIATAAIKMLGGDKLVSQSRTADIVANAAHAILSKESQNCTGNFFIDEDVLRESGEVDFDKYAVSPGKTLCPDFFLD